MQVAKERRDLDSFVTAGKGFDGFLALMALANSGAEMVGPLPAQASKLFRSDDSANALTAALQAHSAEEAEHALKTLTELRGRSTADYAYILDVFAANHELDLRRTGDAERHFLSALAKNPYLTSAWFDLGNVYYAMFMTPEAWACWDAARALNPKNSLRERVDALEQRLLKEWPDFF
jgi:tetratricopeptide (TPR) repeat protein